MQQAKDFRAPLSRFEQDESVDYQQTIATVHRVRKILNRPLTYAEKVLYSHMNNVEDAHGLTRGSSQILLRPRRIACQDATAQMALIQFMSAGLEKTAVPTTIHCDHLIVSRDGYDKDLPAALEAHGEVYDFMSSAAQRYNMGFWKPGAGIIHQIVLENYAYPAGLMVGTDSHTPNAGGMGMAAIGVGGADAVDVMAGLPLELKAPTILGVKLTGQLSGWSAPKDVIAKLTGILTVKGGNGSVIEYFGPGVGTLSATGMATICNMGAEIGATTSIFPYSDAMTVYLESTGRSELARAARSAAPELRADKAAEYDRVIEINLSELEPRINGPFTPDLSHSISSFGAQVKKEGWPEKLSAGLIGSCTNSSFEDMTRAASLAKQALEAGLKPKMELLVSPGSEKTRTTLEKNGILDTLEKVGGTLLTNACGPCCGSWDRHNMKKGTRNSILTTYNRNFTGRLDSNPATHIFLTSPEIVLSKIFSDDLAFDPTRDYITTDDGKKFKFQPPSGKSLPDRGYENADYVYTGPVQGGSSQSVEVQINPKSDRLQKLAPFEAWNGRDFLDCPVLIKTVGKCTTDHITPAGPWFRYRGHLENISNNTLIGAINSETGEANKVQNWLTGEQGSVPATARAYKAAGLPWVVIADHNYGEGSSREHAALQPRYLGGVAIIAKSFARIHEANLKKQGMLPLKFINEADYDNIQSSDRIGIADLATLAPEKTVTVQVSPTDGREAWSTELEHTFTSDQLEYFRAGSALNVMARKMTNNL
ncbi:aconitate hydratase [Colletotrichum paranaense]|uniref:Aconitate hydratase, mitochondrial n=1 Tax=Colletotrichum paranaense TaxID=1914294 RepID=A0ABQ9T4H3_9PEZI|nr:aconitate hydratase [Colletotrichum paranaense]KAK1546670.1 aconitate hydratase [Colletotrichum paranaense]